MKKMISKLNEQSESVQVATFVALVCVVALTVIFLYGRAPVAIGPEIMEKAISMKVDQAKARYFEGYEFGMKDADAFEEIKETIDPDYEGYFRDFWISKGGLFSSFPEDRDFLAGYEKGLSELTGFEVNAASWTCGIFGCDLQISRRLRFLDGSNIYSN